MQNETLILGATGKTGRRIVERLTKRGVPIRSGSRSGHPPFDWEDPATWKPVVQGIASVYVSYYPDLAFPGAVDAVDAFVQTAVASGVRRLVLLSGRGEEQAERGEEVVRNSSVEWTIIRASWFCQNFSEGHLLEPVLSGEVSFPAGDVAEPFIDAEDIADIAAAALTEERHVGQLYEVTGPRLLTFREAVAEIAKVTGREIRYVPLSGEEYASALLQQGVPTDFVTPLVELCATVLDGRNARLCGGVERALGRPPRDFSDFARAAASCGIWNGSGYEPAQRNSANSR